MSQISKDNCIICSKATPDLSYLPAELVELPVVPCKQCYESFFNEADSAYGTFRPSFGRQSSPENSLLEDCPIHNKQVELFCRDDRCGVCYDCAVFGDHKTHQMVHIEDGLLEKEMKTKQAQFLVKLITNLSLTASRGSNQFLDDEEAKLCKEVEYHFADFINKVFYKKKETLQLVHQTFQAKRDAQLSTNPLGEQLIRWKSEVLRKIDPAGSPDKVQITHKFDILNEDTKKIANTIREWTQSRNSQDSLSGASIPDVKLDTSRFEELLQNLNSLIITGGSSKSASLNSLDQEMNSQKLLKSPPSTERGSHNDIYRATLSRKSIEELVPSLFDVTTKGDTVELKNSSSSKRDSPQKNSDLTKLIDSNAKSIKLDISTSKTNANAETCLDFLFKKHDVTKLQLDLNIDLISTDFNQKMDSIFKNISGLKEMTQLSLKLTETAEMSPNTREDLLSSVFGALKGLKQLEKLSLEFGLSNINDAMFLDIMKGIAVCTKVKNLELTIKPGSAITDDVISYMQVIWAKMLYLQKFRFGVEGCSHLTSKGLQDFLKSMIQLKSMKEIYLDVKGCWNVRRDNIGHPDNCKRTVDDNGILVRRLF